MEAYRRPAINRINYRQTQDQIARPMYRTNIVAIQDSITPPHLLPSSPKTPQTVIKRRPSASSISSTTSTMSSQSESEHCNIEPLTTYRLKPITQRVRTMNMSILDNGNVCLEFYKVKNGVDQVVEVFTVSKNGKEIVITNGGNKSTKCFTLSQLPEKFHKKYEHARKFVTLVKSKTPKVTLYNQHAKCMLMENYPSPNFEVHFYSGRKLISDWSGMKLVDEKQGSILSLSTPKIQQQFSQEIQHLIKQAEQFQKQCVQLEALIKSTATPRCDKNDMFPVMIGKRPTPCPSKTEEPQTSACHHPVNRSSVSTCSSGSDKSQRTSGSDVTSYSTSSNLSCYSNATCSSVNSVSSNGANIIRQVRVKNIGIASQLESGDIWVAFEDGSHLGIKPTVTTVTYITKTGGVTKFRKSEPLPENVKVKLASVPIVLQQLKNSQNTELVN